MITFLRRWRTATRLLLALVLFTIPAEGATLFLSGTVPTTYVDGPANDCTGTARPIATAPVPLRVYMRYWPAGSDSLSAAGDSLSSVMTGSRFLFMKQVSSGLYRMKAWAQFSMSDVVVCDTTITRMIRGPVRPPTVDP